MVCMMILSKLIKIAYRNDGVISAYIYGDFGYGKTSYALWTAYEVLGRWNRVLDYLFFDPFEAVKVMERAIRKGRRLPIIIMDDAGLWLDKMTWWESSKVAFMEFFNLIRSVTAGIIFTTPSEELPKQILNKSFFRIAITPISIQKVMSMGRNVYEKVMELVERFGLEERFCLATGYKLKTLPSFYSIVKKEFYDVYPQWYPVYKQYTRKRRKALKIYFERWRSRLKEDSEDRESLFLMAKDMIKQGYKRHEVVKKLVRQGISKATAYRWIKKIVELEHEINM